MRLRALRRTQNKDGTCLFTDDDRQVTVFLHGDQWKALGEPEVLIVTLEEAADESDRL